MVFLAIPLDLIEIAFLAETFFEPRLETHVGAFYEVDFSESIKSSLSESESYAENDLFLFFGIINGIWLLIMFESILHSTLACISKRRSYGSA